MGQLPPPCRLQARFRTARCGDIQDALGMGERPSPPKRSWLDKAEVFRPCGNAWLVVLRWHCGRAGLASSCSLVSCSFCANRKACEGSVRPESLRPELDSVSVRTLRRRSASCAFMIWAFPETWAVWAGNSHARFLEGGPTATLAPYSAEQSRVHGFSSSGAVLLFHVSKTWNNLEQIAENRLL